MNALTKAFADTERSYLACKASVSKATTQLLATGPSGPPAQQADLSRAQEQLRHFTGWVYAAVRPICQRIAAQPIRVGRVTGGPKLTKSFAADATPFEEHPLLDLLADPNGLMVAWSLMYVTVASLELTGRALWWLPKRKQVLPIPTSWIVDIAGATRFEAFSVRPPTTAEAFTIPADECCYFAYPDPANPRGAMSPLQAVGGAVDADEAMAVSQTAMFRRGIHPSHAILVGKQPVEGIPGGLRPQLTAAQQRQIISAVLKRYSGVERHGEPIILDGMIEDIRRLSNTPAEMDWLNSGKVTKDRIFQGFGTNPIIAGQIEGANRASATAADKHFADWTVNPKIELMSQTMTEWLSPMFGGGLTIWIEPCVANDADISLQWTTLLAQNGVLTAHELRTLAPLGLKVEKAFDGRLVGGENMTTSNPIMNGIRGILKAELGNLGAEQIMAQLGVGP